MSTPPLASIHNSKIQFVRKLLANPKERREAGCFIAEGTRLVEEARSSGWRFRFVLAEDGLQDRAEKLIADLRSDQVEVLIVTGSLMRSISDLENSQGVLAVLENRDLPIAHPLTFVVVADQVRDPGNLGTLLRSALAAGAQAVFLPPETVDAFEPKVVRAGMGAHFRLPIQKLGWLAMETRFAGFEVFLADMQADLAFWQADFTGPMALILGGEAQGASPQALRLATRRVKIPMPGGSESLNVSAAGAILMFEVVRQRSGSPSREGRLV